MNTTVVSSVVSLFLIILIGVYASKKKIITPEINKALSNILVNIALPLLILSSFMTDFDSEIKANVYSTFYYGAIAYVVVFVASNIMALPVKVGKRDVVNFSNLFTNTGFMGYPLLELIFGSEGVIYGAAFGIIFNSLVWSYGVMLFKGFNKDNDIKKELLNVIKNPTIIAIIIGMIIMIFSIEIPKVIHSTLSLVGGMTAPLSMIVIGVILSNLEIKNQLKDWTLYYATALTLIVMPLIVVFLFRLIGASSLVTSSIVVQMAMPPATLMTLFAEKYEKELDFSTVLLVISTILSVITIPFIISLL